jgi:hypothetical protein
MLNSLNRQSWVKMFLSAITAPIVLAHQLPANLIRHSYSRYEYEFRYHLYLKEGLIDKGKIVQGQSSGKRRSSHHKTKSGG